MNCPAEQCYRHTLLSLQAAGIRYCVIGSFGLGLYHPGFPLYPVEDCDLMLKNDTDNLNKLAQVLQSLHWQLYLWEEPIAYPLPMEQLAGKYYIRAKRQATVLDATYEYASIAWAAFEDKLTFIEGIPVASLEQILFMKRLRNRDKDHDVIKNVIALVNAFSPEQ